MRILNIFFCLIFLFTFSYCNNNNWIKYYKKEYLPREAEGEIKNIELWKGGILNLQIKNNIKEEEISIHTDYKVLMQIQKGDYFKKISNSNMCFINRGDSIIYIDCYTLSDQDRKSIKNLKEWKLEDKNIWLLNK